MCEIYTAQTWLRVELKMHWTGLSCVPLIGVFHERN